MVFIQEETASRLGIEVVLDHRLQQVLGVEIYQIDCRHLIVATLHHLAWNHRLLLLDGLGALGVVLRKSGLLRGVDLHILHHDLLGLAGVVLVFL